MAARGSAAVAVALEVGGGGRVRVALRVGGVRAADAGAELAGEGDAAGRLRTRLAQVARGRASASHVWMERVRARLRRLRAPHLLARPPEPDPRRPATAALSRRAFGGVWTQWRRRVALWLRVTLEQYPRLLADLRPHLEPVVAARGAERDSDHDWLRFRRHRYAAPARGPSAAPCPRRRRAAPSAGEAVVAERDEGEGAGGRARDEAEDTAHGADGTDSDAGSGGEGEAEGDRQDDEGEGDEGEGEGEDEKDPVAGHDRARGKAAPRGEAPWRVMTAHERAVAHAVLARHLAACPRPRRSGSGGGGGEGARRLAPRAAADTVLAELPALRFDAARVQRSLREASDGVVAGAAELMRRPLAALPRALRSVPAALRALAAGEARARVQQVRSSARGLLELTPNRRELARVLVCRAPAPAPAPAAATAAEATADASAWLVLDIFLTPHDTLFVHRVRLLDARLLERDRHAAAAAAAAAAP